MVVQRTFAERISVILDYLKKQKIPQYEVEERLNYTSLSKAKSFDKYPQAVIEKKSREELYNELLKEFGLVFDEVNECVVQIGDQILARKDEDILFYVMYYYAFARETVGKAIVRVINNKHVIMDYRDEHWEGTYEIIENYTFLLMEKIGGVTPVKKLICLFSGTKKTGRPILLGTYSTIKRDGFPAAGKILFERVFDKKALEKKIKGETDPRIAYYLKNKVIVAETFTPNTLDNLTHWYKMIHRFTGKYYFLYPRGNIEMVRAEMECNDDSGVELIINNITFNGTISPIDNHTIKIEVNDEAGYSEVIANRIELFINTSKSDFDPFYYGVGISNVLESKCNCFSCLLIERSAYQQTDDEKKDRITKKILSANSSLVYDHFIDSN